MKITIKVLLSLFLCLALVQGGIIGVFADYTYQTPESYEATPFDAVRVTGINQRVNSLLSVEGGKHVLWAEAGKPSGIVNLNFAVQHSDWSNATEIRIRFKSNKLPDAYSNSADNNMAIGFGVKSANSNKILLKQNLPYSNLKFTNPNGQTHSPLYFINSDIPYFNFGRKMNCYVQGNISSDFACLTDYVQSTPLGDTWYQLYSSNLPNTIFDYVGEYNLEDDSIYTGNYDKGGNALVNDCAVDMSQVKFVYIRLEPMNYPNMCVDFGNIDVKIDGQWVTVVDISKAVQAQKDAGVSWYETIINMSANQYILDPNYQESTGTTTDAFKVDYITATACELHRDNNYDALCDVCYGAMPHSVFDLDSDGVCDDCGVAICDSCIDENLDGACDICLHTDKVEAVSPNQNSSSSVINSSSINNSANENEFSLWWLIIALPIVAVFTVILIILKKKK